MPDVSIQSALGVLLNYNGLTNRFIEGSPTYITEGISDSSITSNGTIFSGTNGYLVKTFGNTTLNKYYPEFKITCSGYLRDLRDITKDILYPVYSGNIKYNLSDVQIRLLIKLVQAPNTLGRISSDDNRILALEKKIEELTKIISNGINRRNEEITTGDVGDGK